MSKWPKRTYYKGRIGRRRIYLTEEEIKRDYPDGNLYRLPVWGNKLVIGHWYAEVLYPYKKMKIHPYDRWFRPVFLHFAGYGSALTPEGDRVIVLLFDEMINDTGNPYITTNWENGLISLGGVDESTPLFHPSPQEIEKVKRRAYEQRHGWTAK